MSETPQRSSILVLNCGSSSLKYAAFDGEEVLRRGAITRIGTGGAPDHGAAVHAVLEELSSAGLGTPSAVGHRLVHGGPLHAEPERVDDALLASLARVVPFAPLHLPAELSAIAAARRHFGDVPQVACFDTAFHHTLPAVARRYALPSSLYDAGVRRYGFHGLSYESVVASLGAPTLGRAVIAHLGSGASMVAIRDGKSIDTTMGFTPAGGLVMGTRPGDLDPGLLVYLLEHAGYDARSLARLVDHEAGLLALSGSSADMQQLLATRATDARAALAVDVFCHHARKWIGALATTLGGLDTLVFTGGIGEHAPEVRAEICRGLEHLGVSLDAACNERSEAIVSASTSACVTRVARADEERVIARETRRLTTVVDDSATTHRANVTTRK